jgi:hypothetical protein
MPQYNVLHYIVAQYHAAGAAPARGGAGGGGIAGAGQPEPRRLLPVPQAPGTARWNSELEVSSIRPGP